MFLKLIDAFFSDSEKKGRAEMNQTPPAKDSTMQSPAEAKPNVSHAPLPVLPECARAPDDKKSTAFFSWLKALDRRYIFGSAMLTVIIALAVYSKALVVVPAFIVVSALSRYLQLGFPFVIGVDLCLFLTVLAGLAYGSVWGAIAGLGSALLGIVVKNTRNPEEKLAFYLGMVFIGYLAPHIPIQSVYSTGIAATIIYDVIVVYGYFYLVRKCIVNAFTFTSTHILFNAWLFSSFGQDLLSIIS